MFLLGFLGVGVELASWERNAMRAAALGMVLVALVAFASDRAQGQPNPFQQQQPRRGLDNLLDDNKGITGPAQAVVPAANQLDVPAKA